MPTDERFGQRTAQQGPCHQAEGGGRHGDGGRAGQAQLLQQRGKAAGRAVTAAHGNGPRGHAEERAQPHPPGDAHRNEVLRDDEHGHQADHHQQGAAALPEHLEIGLEAHRGEKEHHAEVFHRPVKAAFDAEARIQEQGEQRHQQPARNRRRDAETPQERDFPRQKQSQEQGHNPHSRAGVCVQGEGVHIFRLYRYKDNKNQSNARPE